MGTDIHIVAQTYITDKWVDIEVDKILSNRNYAFFTFLDGTREYLTNVNRKIGIIPLSSPRGCPEDFELNYPNEQDTYHGEIWMGYGVSSWATLDEIEKHLLIQPITEYPVAPIEAMREMFKGYLPEDCRLVWGYDS